MPSGVYVRTPEHRRQISERSMKLSAHKKGFRSPESIDKMVITKLKRVLEEKKPIVPQVHSKTTYDMKKNRRDAILAKLHEIIDAMPVGTTFDTLSMRVKLGKVRGSEVDRCQLKVYLREFPLKYHRGNGCSPPYYEVIDGVCL
jgi:hypothetical protein